MNTILIVGNIWQGPLYSCVVFILHCVSYLWVLFTDLNLNLIHLFLTIRKKKYEISNNKYYLLSPGLMKYMLSISYYYT